MKTKLMIAKWEDESYTLFALSDTTKQEIFETLDSMADPFCCRYKIFTVEHLVGLGFNGDFIETQKDIGALYECHLADVKSQKISEKDFKGIYENY